MPFNSGGWTPSVVIPTITTGNLTESTSSILTIGNGTSAVVGSGTTITVTKADATHNGYLSSTDWSTFNAAGTGGTLKDLTGITSAHTEVITIPNTTTFNKSRVNVLKFVAGGSNVTTNDYTFAVGDATKFTYDSDYLVFDNKLHFKNTFTTAMTDTTLGAGQLFEATYDASIYKSVENIEVT